MDQGTLFVVATPIGNLGDLSPRAQDVLQQVDRIAAEDTRVTGRLLSHFGITARQTALHDHNEKQAVPALIEALKSGESVALVSDAGTPLVSDPGYRLVRAAHAAGLTVSPVPGPSAAIAALSASGLPSDRFVFEGFLPARRPARRTRLESRSGELGTLLFFESVHRIGETVEDMVAVYGRDRPASIGRELSKRHEQCVSATLGELKDMLADGRIPGKGEFVIGVAGATTAADADSILADDLLRELSGLLPGKQAIAVVAKVTGLGRNALYQRLLALKNEQS